MHISDLKAVFCPEKVALSAIGGCIAGRFCRISPLHGAIYAVVSGVVNLATFWTGMNIVCDLENRFPELKRLGGTNVIALLSTTSVFLAFTAGNKALSLIGKPLIFSTAVKVCLISEMIGLSSRLFMNVCESRKNIH